LLRYFKPWISGVSIFLVFASTNLFYYSVGEAEMSHSYLFFLYSVIIYNTLKWNDKKKRKNLVWLSLAMGMCVLIRPTSLLFASLPVLYLFSTKENRFWISNNLKIIFSSLLVFFLPIFLQMLFWKTYGSGWVRWSYRNEGFFFDNPHILEFLFGYRNGWLLYTPIMIFALASVFVLPQKLKSMKYSIFIILPLAIYILSSWWCWWFGGSFGGRTMIEFYAILVFPLVCIISLSFIEVNA